MRTTDPQSPESVEHLTAKTHPYADNWTPMADKLWSVPSRLQSWVRRLWQHRLRPVTTVTKRRVYVVFVHAL